MKKGLKYRLIRTASEILIVSTLATGISHLATNIKFPKEVIPYTQEDVVQNIQFEKKLSSIQEETNIEFSNLYSGTIFIVDFADNTILEVKDLYTTVFMGARGVSCNISKLGSIILPPAE